MLVKFLLLENDKKREAVKQTLCCYLCALGKCHWCISLWENSQSNREEGCWQVTDTVLVWVIQILIAFLRKQWIRDCTKVRMMTSQQQTLAGCNCTGNMDYNSGKSHRPIKLCRENGQVFLHQQPFSSPKEHRTALQGALTQLTLHGHCLGTPLPQ